jgi:hypothetical protein
LVSYANESHGFRPLAVGESNTIVTFAGDQQTGLVQSQSLSPRPRHARARAAETAVGNGRATVAVTDRTVVQCNRIVQRIGEPAIQLPSDSAARSDSQSVCQHRLTLFSSARLRLALARAGKQSVGCH